MNSQQDFFNSISMQLDGLLQPAVLPPVHRWNPPLSGDMNLLIRRDGVWLHEGAPILRKELVRLFSTVLKREGHDYFLVTPVEKWRIQVEAAPLHAVLLNQIQQNDQAVLIFETLTNDVVIVDAQHPIRVEVDPLSHEPSPFVLVRDNLEAIITRSAFYQLIDLAVQEAEQMVVYSAGQRFLLGEI